jgi:hypothetical protein
MKFFPKMSFKYLAILGAMVASTAYAYGPTWSYCDSVCSDAARNAGNQAAQGVSQQMAQSCGSIPDATARNQCFNSISATAQQQYQTTYTSVYNQCMGSCYH